MVHVLLALRLMPKSGTKILAMERNGAVPFPKASVDMARGRLLGQQARAGRRKEDLLPKELTTLFSA